MPRPGWIRPPLTIFGLGLSGLIGAPFVGARRDPVTPLDIPALSDIPVIGRLLFEQDLFVYASHRAHDLWSPSTWTRTRSGLTLRSIGENHTSANALGSACLAGALLVILFGGACAGLAGAYLALVYTRFWVARDDGRAGLDRAGARGLRGLATGGCWSAPIFSALRRCCSSTPRPLSSAFRLSSCPRCRIWRPSSPCCSCPCAMAGPSEHPAPLECRSCLTDKQSGVNLTKV